ncbi:MAG: DUF4262 domain-containing protein [Thermoanaerobaculia bacterium]
MLELLPEPEPQSEPDRKVLADVQSYGLHVVHVLPQAGTPGWSYSIGLFRSRGQPEVVVFGLDSKVAHFVVNELGRRAAVGPLLAEQVHDGLLESFPCVLKPVLPVWFRPFFGYALWYYRHVPVPILQCIWPDRSSLYPWQAGFNAAWRWAQPLLYVSDPAQANVQALLSTLKPEAAG